MFDSITLKGIGPNAPKRSTLRGMGPKPELSGTPLEATWDDESNVHENGFSLFEILWFKSQPGLPRLYLTSEDPLGAPFTLGELILANEETGLPHELVRGLCTLAVGTQFRIALGAHGAVTFTRVR